jgi:hypothetical protein
MKIIVKILFGVLTAKYYYLYNKNQKFQIKKIGFFLRKNYGKPTSEEGFGKISDYFWVLRG